MIKRLKNNLLHLNNLRKFIGYETFNSATKSGFKHQILKSPPKGDVLVLSPHPDDDVIGCGGSIKLHRDQGDNVEIIYLCGGNEREKEAKAAASILGATGTTFWRYADGKLQTNKTSVELLRIKILSLKPDLIYVPSFLDPHPDHFETAKLVVETLAKMSSPQINSLRIYSYEVWSPIYANRLINIDKSITQKKEALAAHKSQLKDRNYQKAMSGLAQYRAGMFNVGDYAEAFFECNAELLIKLFNLVNLK